MVRFENVGLRYGMGSEILKDLTFSIEPHSFQFLTGPSGAGKTTLLRLILLSLKPTRGLITHLRTRCRPRWPRTRSPGCAVSIGVVFQDFQVARASHDLRERRRCRCGSPGREEATYRSEVVELAALGRSRGAHACSSADPLGRREAARRHRAGADHAAGIVARRRADRQCRSHRWRGVLLRLFMELHKSGTSVVIATHDLALDGPVRGGATIGAGRPPPACLRVREPA